MAASIREKELRLALVCYGGVSLAVYMHGVTKELWKLLKASQGRAAGLAAPSGDSEPHWRRLLDDIGETIDLRVVCDILAGASAGGINAVLLADAITRGTDMEPLRALWLDGADVERMLDPDARPKGAIASRLASFYKEPVAWLAGRRSASLATVDDPMVRGEITMKLARFVRSRWFKPPFSGDGFTAMLDDAMLAMAAPDARQAAALVPPTLAVDLYVTATDYFGRNTDLAIHSPPIVSEREHRHLFHFVSPAISGKAGSDASRPRPPLGDRPELVFAARATASFPGAFPPATLGEIDRRLAARGETWPGRARFVASQMASDRPAEAMALIDGSVLANAPFGPAIAAIQRRPAHREVDRRFVYIDPKPGLGGVTDGLDGRPPGFFTAMLRALADIPREQPIRDSLEQIAAISARVRRIRAVTDGMQVAVDAAIQRAVGTRFFLLPLSAERLAKARSRIHSVAAREAGFVYAGYAQLKMRAVLDGMVEIAAEASGADPPARQKIAAALLALATEQGAFDATGATQRDPDATGYVQLLRAFDIGFRVRRLRFVIRQLTAALATAGPAARSAGERAKAAFHAAAARFESSPPGPGEAEAIARHVRALLGAGGPEGRAEPAAGLMAAMAAMLDLGGLDGLADAALIKAATDPDLGRPTRQALVRAWLGFPFYDIAILPLMRDDAAYGFGELKVDRISPDDATSLCADGARACLKGWQLNAFAAFFARAYRENDYLWGRLHSAERLVDILLDSARASGARDIDPGQAKRRLFAAILAEERTHLGNVTALIDRLEAALDSWPG